MEKGKGKRRLSELKQRIKTWSSIHRDEDGDGDDENGYEEEKEDREEKRIKEEARRDWSSLTHPLLLSIVSRLTTLEDFFAFRGVCAHWRSLCAPVPSPPCVPSQSPLLLLAAAGSGAQPFYDIARRRCYRVRVPWDADSRFALGYAHGYVVTVSRIARSRPLLWTLFSGEALRFPRAPLEFKRAILTANPAEPGCLLVLVDLAHSVLQYCHPGDCQWSVYRWSEPGSILNGQFEIVDVIFFKGKLYVLTSTGGLGFIDLVAGLSVILFEGGLTGHTCKESGGIPWWLAEARGELLMVSYYDHPDEVGFKLWCWDFTRCGWVEMRSLDGWTLFVGSNGFAASIPPVGYGVRGNCIYCSGSSCDNWTVYCWDDGSYHAESVPELCLKMYLLPMPAVWVFPSICC